MAKKEKAPNNHVAEWFGHRVHPTVGLTAESIQDFAAKRCPFLSAITGDESPCVKRAEALGICTISACSNGPRQDWLVCPHRALDRALLETVARRIFDVPPKNKIVIRPAPSLDKDESRKALSDAVARGDLALVYMQSRLGGEVSLSKTARSPELSFDTTLIELGNENGALTVKRYSIMEVQTMDFHGTYKKAVKNLVDGLRLHPKDFAHELGRNTLWLSEEIQGPNIANVFKRTLYQIILKFQLSGHAACAGSALAIPASVWDSWQRHLGAPPLEKQRDGTYHLYAPNHVPARPSWIYVFDLDATSQLTPNPIVISKVIATDADSIAHYALKVAPEAAIASGGSADRVLMSIRLRLATWWPVLGVKP